MELLAGQARGSVDTRGVQGEISVKAHRADIMNYCRVLYLRYYAYKLILYATLVMLIRARLMHSCGKIRAYDTLNVS